MDHLWILVADRSGALFFRRNRPSRGVELIREIPHPEGRLKARELSSDKDGRSFQFAQHSLKHAYSAPTSPEEELSRDFARDLAHILDQAHGRNEYRHLVLVAGPAFLGHLRTFLHQARESLIGSVNKNLGRVNGRELENHIVDVLDQLDSDPRLGRAV